MKQFLLLLSFIALIAPAHAADKKTTQQTDIAKAEKYLQGLSTARARFVQTAHNGVQLVGTFYLDRPGKLKFEYDPPIEDYVVADGLFIYFYDAEAQQQTNAPIGQTLADFILRDDISLTEDVIIKEVKRGGGLLQIHLVQASDPDAGSLVLGFEEDPFQLKKWRVIDAQGLITEVELFYLKTDITHPRGLFAFVDPNKGKQPRYND